jgi:hypothetical protein
VIANGTPFDKLFADLSDRMGVLHTTDTDPSQRDRVIWERAGALTPEPIRYTRAGVKLIGRLGHPWTARVYGASDLEVSQRVAQLLGWIDELVGPPQGCETEGHDGYKFAPGEIAPQGGDGKAAGRGCDVAVTLYQPVASQIRPPATITRINVAATALAGGGASDPGTINAAAVAS